MIQRTNHRGQTALVLILLAAGALIFYAITLNWGRIAQEKATLTIAANQSAAVLASDAASYGEIAKVQYLNDTNENSSVDLKIILAIIMIILAIVALIVTWGGASPFVHFLLVFAIVMASASFVLQMAVIEPMITSLWNKLQKNQPVQQQFYEQGISTALMGAVTDPVSITDYFDSNANGLFGFNSSGLSNDTAGISRFALFYMERLKMLNGTTNVPQVQAFYNALQQLVNGLLTDPCPAGSDPNDPNYNPFCDPCCQPYYGVPDPFFNPNNPNPPSEHASAYETLRPSSCAAPVTPCDISSCSATVPPSPGTSCDPYSAVCVPSTPGECVTNNPYTCDDFSVCSNGLCKDGNSCGAYPYIYDSAYQNYATGTSFLQQFGRDVQKTLSNGGFSIGPPTPTPPAYTPNWTPEGIFPNGVFPFFWIMAHDSPEVDKITAAGDYSEQAHWCTSSKASLPPPISLANPYVTAFPDLCQLGLTSGNGECVSTLPPCAGPTCCVGNLSDNVADLSHFTKVIDRVGNIANPALDASFGVFNNPPQWIQGDNQYCSATWPYNGSSLTLPDGTCELTGTSSAPDASATTLSGTTLDRLDETEHILSDFVKFANVFLSKDVGTLTSTFSTWYPQVAEWIAPACGTTCSNSGSWSSYANSLLTCNDGADGRLLGIYNPCTGFDLFSQWGAVLTDWLEADYTQGSPWCLPPHGDPSLFTVVNGSPIPTDEDNYIAAHGGRGNWGDIDHVIACLDYNASVAPVAYQNCLNELAQNQSDESGSSSGLNGCYVPISDKTYMSACLPVHLGRSLDEVSPNHPFTPSSNGTPTPCNGQNCPRSLNPCPPHVLCIDTSQSVLSTNSTTVQGQGTTTVTITANNCTYLNPMGIHECNCHVIGVSSCTPVPLECSQLHPCLPPPVGACTHCDSCEICSDNTITTSFQSQDCDPTQAGSFANWVNDSLTLATDAQPKFTLRSSFLSGVDGGAKQMLTIIGPAELALKAFLNGPAANLMAARLSSNATGAALPNAVIYGWVEKPPMGGGGCKDSNGNKTGCAHAVKATVYSPGRCGSTGSLCNTPVSPVSSNISSTLPWIKTALKCPMWGLGVVCLRNYDLRDRDAYVYVKVQRWDQDHSSSITFPNQLPLWQFSFQNPKTPAVAISGSNVFADHGCFSGLQALPNSTSSGTGFGLTNQMFTALSNYSSIPGTNGQISVPDASALGSAFMLNDEGSGPNAGVVDGYARTFSGAYNQCLSFVNSLLKTGIESHACAAYVATDQLNAIDPKTKVSPQSGDNSANYTIFFEPCPSSTSQMNDLMGDTNSS